MKFLSIIAAFLLISSSVQASGMIAGATFPEQIVQELTLVQQYATQAEQLQAQYQQIYNQAINMQTIPVQLWPSIANQLTTLVNMVGNAQGLSYAAQNTVSAIQAQYGQPNAALSNYSSSLANWTSNTDNQISAVLQQYKLNSQNYQSVQSALAAINNQSQTANGRKAVLQAGNQIAGLIVNQLQTLQSDIEAGNQAQLNAVAAMSHSQNDNVQNIHQTLIAPVQPGAF
jgi:P-type conjugative transfer protein TrbJ